MQMYNTSYPAGMTLERLTWRDRLRLTGEGRHGQRSVSQVQQIGDYVCEREELLRRYLRYQNNVQVIFVGSKLLANIWSAVSRRKAYSITYEQHCLDLPLLTSDQRASGWELRKLRHLFILVVF